MGTRKGKSAEVETCVIVVVLCFAAFVTASIEPSSPLLK